MAKYGGKFEKGIIFMGGKKLSENYLRGGENYER